MTTTPEEKRESGFDVSPRKSARSFDDPFSEEKREFGYSVSPPPGTESTRGFDVPSGEEKRDFGYDISPPQSGFEIPLPPEEHPLPGPVGCLSLPPFNEAGSSIGVHGKHYIR